MVIYQLPEVAEDFKKSERSCGLLSENLIKQIQASFMAMNWTELSGDRLVHRIDDTRI